MKRVGVLVILLGCFASAAWAQQTQSATKPNVTVAKPLVLYDNFNGPRIDPAKWVGTWGDTSDLLETVRELVPTLQGEGNNRYLRLSLDSYAPTFSDYGGIGGGFGLNFSTPASITETSFTVTVRAAKAVGCETNPSQDVAVAEFRGRFFNTESSPTSELGDIEGEIGVNRYSTDTGPALLVSAFYTRCDDDSCGARTTLDFKELGYVYPGQPAKLRAKWDQPNHRFIFQLNHDPEFISPYAVSDQNPPYYGAWRSIALTRVLPNCTSTPRPEAMMDAYFDNVYVNAQ